MHRTPSYVALGCAASGFAWAIVMVATDDPCGGAPGCFDERGPMHPVLTLYLATAGAIVCAAALLLAGLVRAGWFAGLQLLVAVLATIPLAVQQLPDDVVTWLVPAACAWGAAVALLVADRPRWRPARSGALRPR